MGQADVAGCSSSAYMNSDKTDDKIVKRDLDAADIPGVMIGGLVKDDALSNANDGSYMTDEEEEVAVDQHEDTPNWASLGDGELKHVDIQPVFDEYDFNGDLVPAMPEDVVLSPSASGNSILNQTDCMAVDHINKYETALAAYDLRESYMQRHLSPMAS